LVNTILTLFGRAYKRLQLNYYMENNYLPKVNDSTVKLAADACSNYTEITQSGYSCDYWNALFQCLAVPTDWKYYDGGVYMPYAWVQEAVVYDEATADGIKDINDAIEFAYQVQLACFIAAGASNLIATIM
jgi:hypothetical protein